MAYREIIAVYSQIHTKHTNTLCGQNVELLNVKPGAIIWGPICLLCNGYRVSFPAVSGRGVALTTHPRLVPRLKKVYSYTATTTTTTLGLHGLF